MNYAPLSLCNMLPSLGFPLFFKPSCGWTCFCAPSRGQVSGLAFQATAHSLCGENFWNHSWEYKKRINFIDFIVFTGMMMVCLLFLIHLYYILNYLFIYATLIVWLYLASCWASICQLGLHAQFPTKISSKFIFIVNIYDELIVSLFMSFKPWIKSGTKHPKRVLIKNPSSSQNLEDTLFATGLFH